MLEKQAEFTIYENDTFENYFDNHIYFFKYEGIIRTLIINYKFNEKSYIYKSIVNFMIKNEKFCRFLKTYDIIVPVPISKKRYNQRGYNQSTLIARELGSKFGIQLKTNCLIKAKDIIEQSKLSKEERQKNIQGAYIVLNAKKLHNKKILLIDDVYTTGSTANECCKTLHIANVKKVDILTIAKD